MRRLLNKWPSAESIRGNRWLAWLGPALHHPKLWVMSRRGLALGVALGCFFGLLVPLAQIPISAAAAVALRANVPAAVASTLITNPLTLGPIYYAAWRIGSFVHDEPEDQVPAVPMDPEVVADDVERQGWWRTTVSRIQGVGKPLLTGLAILACVAGIVTYFVVSLGWTLSVRWKRYRRLRARPSAGGALDRIDER